jgi:hypothetical protein
MLRRHLQDLHPLDRVRISMEGYFPRCERFNIQVDPRYPQHIRTKECQVGVERRSQGEEAVGATLALRCQFTVQGDVLERINVFMVIMGLRGGMRLRARPRDQVSRISIKFGLILRFGHMGP